MKEKKIVVIFGDFIKQLTVTFILQYDIQGKYKDIRIILPHDIRICRSCIVHSAKTVRR